MRFDYRIERIDGELRVATEYFQQFLGVERSRRHYFGDNVFAIEDFPSWLRFERDAHGRVTSVQLLRPGADRTPVVGWMEDTRPDD